MRSPGRRRLRRRTEPRTSRVCRGALVSPSARHSKASEASPRAHHLLLGRREQPRWLDSAARPFQLEHASRHTSCIGARISASVPDQGWLVIISCPSRSSHGTNARLSPAERRTTRFDPGSVRTRGRSVVMRWIIEASLRSKKGVIVAAAALFAFGIWQVRQADLDSLPDFSPPVVEVQTEALGLSAEEMEQLITVPLEQDLLNGVAWVESIRSQSVPGLSSIVMEFEPGTDLYRARQVVQERLNEAHALPNVSTRPRHAAATVVDEQGHDDQPVVRGADADRARRAGPLDHRPPPHRRPGRVQRGRSGDRRSASSRCRSIRIAWPTPASRSTRSSARPATRCGRRR